MVRLLIYTVCCLAMFACTKNPPEPLPEPEPLPYFPPAKGNWETIDAGKLGWNSAGIDDLHNYLALKKTKAFLILKDGRMVSEKYFGTFTQDSLWYWASAGKTMVGMLVGIAQEEGFLKINDQTSRYLGTGWTSIPKEKEDLITIRNQLSLTTGLKSSIDDDCTLPVCLEYNGDAGTVWRYHNASYTLLEPIIAKATGKTFENYFAEKIRNKISMSGNWIKFTDYINLYYSDARSMARFGILMLNKGKWSGTNIISNINYFNQQVSSSQSLNPAFGFLTWLNGKSSYMIPLSGTSKSGSIVPTAPSDMYYAWGRNDQKIYVVPSQKIIAVRMGESASGTLQGDNSFDTELWGKLKNIIGY
jgi:CubicO group peptidase (beta-lactamase class C family)